MMTHVSHCGTSFVVIDIELAKRSFQECFITKIRNGESEFFQSGLWLLLPLVIVAAFSVQEASAKCYALMGISSCAGQADESFVGASW